MEYLPILEKICDNAANSITAGTHIYIFAAAIYDTWSMGNELEKNMANRLMLFWKTRLENKLKWEYGCTHSHPNRLNYDVYCKKWVNEQLNIYKDHNGIKTALELIAPS
jgi:hypothetical protein